MSEALTFPYVDVGDSIKGESFIPLLPMTLRRNEEVVHSHALVDSGASVSVLPYTVGIRLGLVWEDQHVEFRLSGNLDNLSSKAVMLSVSVGSFELVAIAFAWTRSDAVRLILGQTNFFKAFEVCFFRSQETFEIKPKR